MTTDDQPQGVSPLEHAKRAARRAVECEHGEFTERRIAEIAERLGPADLARFRPTGLRPDARIVAVPNVADPAAGPTPAELATATPLDAFVDDLALATDTTPDHVLNAVRPILTGRATYRGAFIVEPDHAVAFRLRIRGAPYLAEAPIAGSPPGYRLHPDRHQRHQDRHTGGPRRTPRPERFLTRTRLAHGCHPRFMVWCITAAGDLR